MALTVASVQDIGALDRPNNILRDGGQSVFPFGRGKILWLFGDSILPGKSSDCSHARSTPVAPQAVDLGDPDQFIPHTADEKAWNDAHAPKDRFALWTGALIPVAKGEVAIFFNRLHITPEAWTNTGVHVALATPRQPLAVRLGPLFSTPPFFAYGGLHRNKDFIYLYSNEPTGWLTSGHRVARVPVTSYQDLTAWRYWTGTEWSAEASAAALIINPGSSSGLTMNWNAYLQRYLMVYTKPLTSDVYMRIAVAPEGPWEAEVKVFTGEPAGGSGLAASDYSAYEHRELAANKGKSVVVSYAHPLGAWNGEIRLARVIFA